MNWKSDELKFRQGGADRDEWRALVDRGRRLGQNVEALLVYGAGFGWSP